MRPDVLDPYAGVRPDDTPLTDGELQQSISRATFIYRFDAYTLGEAAMRVTSKYVAELDDPVMSDNLLQNMEQNGGLGISLPFYKILEASQPGSAKHIQQGIGAYLQEVYDRTAPTPRRKFFARILRSSDN